ncbi:UDP-glucuronosyl and UDP-glucosyl transferase [Handroanthus impetiginosus]|uniref:Glycosyltransferase n=1 Tax=Handroanthus impetiginosus TaxID=429701 RepID=A0A2G9HEU4_9LAMI|nr:UDP-glucuronosyl and UDP-glucosyl transferase [Handroanthus impetiginosus]
MGSLSLSHSPDVAVLMVPFPLQGHLNQLLHLSRLISAHSVAVHYVGTTTHNRQARRRVHGWDPLSISNIIFHEFPSLHFQSPPPDPNAPIQFPSHLQPLFNASSSLRQPVTDLLRCLSATNRRVVIIYDSLMGSVIQDFVKFPNAESYTFHSVSAYTIFFFLWENLGRPFEIDEEILKKLPSLEGCFTPEFVKFVGDQHEYMGRNSGRIYNTCRVVESPFLELLEKPQISGNKKQWALGPFNPVITGSSDHQTRHKCLQWLDKQAQNSVILVAFGTTTTFSEKQIRELAIGLEKSKQRFIWVLREADGGDVLINGETVKKSTNVDGKLPKGFEERVKERGIIVRDWAPQLEILGHFATGGFMSHCGWNSCMESISMGVPIAAWPMHSDQPRNTILITEVLKIGIVVKDWARRDEIVEAEAVKNGVRRLMASEAGAEMRRRAAELGGAVRKAAAEGGLGRLELDSFISHITR